MATTKKAAVKKTAKKAVQTKVVLADNVLWAVIRRTWFSATIVSVWTSRVLAEMEQDRLTAEDGLRYVVQRAELKGV